jgi:hypothetical protein
MGMLLLLSPPTEVVVKDTARAVKRLDSLTIQAVTAETLNELLGLPGMRVTQFAIEQQGEERVLRLREKREPTHEGSALPRQNPLFPKRSSPPWLTMALNGGRNAHGLYSAKVLS